MQGEMSEAPVLLPHEGIALAGCGPFAPATCNQHCRRKLRSSKNVFHCQFVGISTTIDVRMTRRTHLTLLAAAAAGSAASATAKDNSMYQQVLEASLNE